MIAPLLKWAPAALLGFGAVFTVGVDRQRSMPLEASLSATVPLELEGFRGRDLVISDEEQRVAGMTTYVMRVYSPAATGGEAPADAFSVYVGYYEQQTQGRTIHSPRNCLPGSGWEALGSRKETIETPGGAAVVNRYLLQRGEERALVLYWYQGRARVEANEYVVKWNLLRDSALRGRSEEALVRVLVPVIGGEEEAFRLAERVARAVIPSVFEALPS